MPAQSFSWSLIQLPLCSGDIPLVNLSEIGPFRKVLPEQPVQVFVAPSLPRAVGVCKETLRIQLPGNLLMTGELFAVIEGD